MSMMPVETIFALALLAQPQPLPILRVDDPQPIVCLSADEMRETIADGRVIQPVQASRHARNAAPGRFFASGSVARARNWSML